MNTLSIIIYEQFAKKLFAELNNYVELKPTIDKILELIKEFLNVEAVGIRVKQKNDYPYYSWNGFSQTFIEHENFLCKKDQEGNLVFNPEENNFSLDCMCGLIIRGKTDPKFPFFTTGGSFWTNNTTELSENLPEELRKLKIRGYCVSCGYKSVSMIPIKAKGEIIGLLQINDKSENKFELETIEFLEKIGTHIGLAIHNNLLYSELMESKLSAENRYRLIFENIDEGVAVIKRYNNGEDYIIVEFNSSAEIMGDLKRENVIGKKITEVFPGVRKYGLFDEYESLYHNKDLKIIVKPNYFYDDGRIHGWRSHRIFKIRDDEFVIIYRDTTKEKEKEEQIISVAKFPEEDPDPLLRVDKHGNIMYFNNASNNLLSFWNCVENKVVPHEWVQFINKTLIENKSIQETLEFDNKIYLVSIVPIKDKEYSNLYFKNITEEKKLEHYLSQSAKMEAIGRMAGGVAHDFNNLLTIILGYVDLVNSEKALPPQVIESIKQIYDAAKMASRLTSDLLTFSRQSLFTPKILNINKIIHSMKELLKRVMPENIKIHLSLDENLWDIEGEESKIQQIFLNLSINARDAMENGGILRIETKNVILDSNTNSSYLDLPTGRFILLTISDTGKGMSKDTMNHLFEPFFSTKQKEKGTGLGLSIIYGIVKQMKGFINPYSELNIGTTFKIYLPAIEKKTSIQDGGVVQIQEQLPVNRNTIIFVEDMESIRNFVKTVLMKDDYTVYTANDYKDAKDLVETHKSTLKLVITDLYLPDSNGIEISKMVKKKCPDCNILYVSGYSEYDIKLLSEDTPQFLPKPFTASQLLNKVKEIIKE